MPHPDNMKIKFQPLPGLSIVTAICLAILLTLGTWQYNRLQWKTDLLVQIDEAANAAPLTSLAQVDALMKAGRPIDFRRVALHGAFIVPPLNDGKPFHLMRSNGKAFTWRLYQPIQQGALRAYVAAHEFTEQQKDSPPSAMYGEASIIGYVRLVRPANRFVPKSAPATNRWFAFNGAPALLDWAGTDKSNPIATAYYIDRVDHLNRVEDLPVRKPEIANSHLDYMLTWYSFAVILLIIYLLLHKKQGRLRLERD